MTDNSVFIDQIARSADGWIVDEKNKNLSNFRLLNSTEISIAKKVGVHFPDKIQLLEVDNMPLPTDPLLEKLCDEYDFLGDSSIGLTLGYSVYIRKSHISTRLLSHEFRHVLQYENCGSVHKFLLAYIEQIMTHGYRDAPFEIDARNHEFEALDA